MEPDIVKVDFRLTLQQTLDPWMHLGCFEFDVPDGVSQGGEDSLVFFIEIETEGDKHETIINNRRPTTIINQRLFFVKKPVFRSAGMISF